MPIRGSLGCCASPARGAARKPKARVLMNAQRSITGTCRSPVRAMLETARASPADRRSCARHPTARSSGSEYGPSPRSNRGERLSGPWCRHSKPPGTRICRRWPDATSLGGSLAVVRCGAGSAERQAEELSPRPPLPSPWVNQRQHRQRPSGRETQPCGVGRYSSSCASLTAIRVDFERLGLRSNRTTGDRLLALRLPPALALPVLRLLHLQPLERPPANVAGLGVFRHEPLVAVLEHLLPRLQAMVGQAPNREHHVLLVQDVLDHVAADVEGLLSEILAAGLQAIEHHEERRGRQIRRRRVPEPLESGDELGVIDGHFAVKDEPAGV